MAASSSRILKHRILRWPIRIAGGLALVAAIYLLAAWIGSSISRNSDWEEPSTGGVVIAVESNGVHTSLILPLVTAQKDWRMDFPLSDIAAPNRPYTHISISWGERDVFLKTPTWWDLSPLLVLKIITEGGQGLEHVSFYFRPSTSETVRPIRLSDAQYTKLVTAIEAGLPNERPLTKHPGYGRSDVFYDAKGRYTPIHTCNQWTGNRLADAGVKVGRWTPLEGSVMKWLQISHNPDALTTPGIDPP